MNKTPKRYSKNIFLCQLGAAGICFEFSTILFVERFGNRIILLKYNAGLRKVHFKREQLAGRKGFHPVSGLGSPIWGLSS